VKFNQKTLILFLKNQKKNVLKAIYHSNHIGLRSLFREQSLQVSCLLSTTIALLYVFYLFPLSFLAGHGAFFERGEPLISISGWWAFKASIWQFPLLHTNLLNYPQGINIAFTNSIPLLAILLKPLKSLLPSAFHYFGIWFAISYILQATSATVLVRILGQRTLLATIASTSMALMMPTFLFQMEYIALLAQGYILCALALYFAGVKNTGYFKKVTFYFHVLIALAFLTHPYLFSMVTIIYLAYLGDHYLKFKSPRAAQQSLIALATTTAIIVGIMIAGGYLSHKIRAAGYSYYSMNLLAPFYGGKLGYPFVNATGGQHRGFNYLGAGMISALVFTIVTRWRWVTQIIKRYRTFTISLLLLMIFSISNHIFYGTTPVLHYGLIHPFKLITEIFPSSGRMFWPVGYTLMLIGLLGVLRFENKRISVGFILIMLSLQFYDTQPLRRNIYNIARKPSIIHPSWHRLMRSVWAVQVYPAYGCVNAISHQSQARNHTIFLQGLAARYGRPINTACFARSIRPNCAAKHAPFNKRLMRGQLYVVHPAARHVPYHINKAIASGWCRQSNHGILCVPYTHSKWWQARTPPSILKRKYAPKKQKSWFQNINKRVL